MSQSFRRRPADAGRRQARYVRQHLGEELRIARLTAGLTQAQVAVASGLTQEYVSAVERGARNASVDAACLLAAAVGHDLSVRLYPSSGVRLRDSGQVAMATEMVAAASSVWHPQLEVPVSDTDGRAADLVLIGPAEVLHIEIERKLVDFQAQLRAAKLKREALSARFAQPVRLIMALPNRRSSHAAVDDLRELISRTMPIDSGQIRRAITQGADVGGDGILFWPVPRSQTRPTST